MNRLFHRLGKRLELKGLEAPDELQINVVTQQATQPNPEKPNQLFTTVESQVATETSVVESKERKTRPETTRLVPAISTATKTVVRQNVTPTRSFPTIPTRTMQITEMTENQDLSTHPAVKLTIPRKNVTLEQTQLIDCLHGTDDREDRITSNKD